MAGYPQSTKDAFQPILDALDAFPITHGVPDLLVVRPGYRYERATPAGNAAVGKVVAKPALVLAVAPKSFDAALAAAPALEKKLGVPVVPEEATLDEQTASYDSAAKKIVPPLSPHHSRFEDALRDRLPVAFAPKERPPYKAPASVKLREVNAHMKARFSVSPEQGWPLLEAFLGTVKSDLAVSMYQFTAPHIADAVRSLAEGLPGDVDITLHPVPEPPAKSGVKANDRPEADTIAALEQAAPGRFGFQWAPVFAGGLFASAYHIKVAVGDGDKMWLSSGNWQSSNQPGPTILHKKPSGFQHKYNRDYHVTIESKELAGIFGKFLAFDFEMANQIAHEPPKTWEGPAVVLPDDYQPADFAAVPKYFDQHLEIDRKVRVQPLLTPDNYATRVLEVVQSATERIWFQNQYITLKEGAADNYPEFFALVKALIEKQQAGVEVRVICRDLMDSDKLHLLVARGLDPDSIRFQSACHNKCIIVDSQTIVFGSHNWSNDGAVTNRDASLIFYDAEVAKYFEKIYDYDWENLATAAPAKPRKAARVAEDGEDGTPLDAIDR
jgi:hypothetical protein